MQSHPPPPPRAPPFFCVGGHTLFYYIGGSCPPGAIQRKGFWKVASLKHAQVLREGCAFANGVVVSRSYRCPNFRLCCRHSHRYSNHPSMFINQTHHYHNYSPPDTSPHYNMQ